MEIAIVGAGYAGLTAAYELGRAGHQVTVYEALPEAGGLAAGFRAPHWSWPLEKFYHHLFTNDEAILGLAERLGIGGAMRRYRPSTDLIHEGQPYPFDSPLNVLRFPGFTLPEKLRTGLAMLYLKVQRDWQRFEEVTAHEWLGRALGSAYDKQWEALLRGKFGDEHYREVAMTWFWARIFKRTPSLIYPDGGFQTITDALVAGVQGVGATIHLATPVQALAPRDGGWLLSSPQGDARYDRVIATVSPHLLTRLVPALPQSYLASLHSLKSMGAVVMTVSLAHPLTERSYWLNLDKRHYPMLSLVEHTNMVDPRHYGGDRLIYMGDYLPADHPYLAYDAEQLFEIYEPVLRAFNPDYERGWVQQMWSYSTRYAQPVPPRHYARQIPARRTPLPGLYFASMSQVYPWDRGTNYAVELGQQVAADLLADGSSLPADRESLSLPI